MIDKTDNSGIDRVAPNSVRETLEQAIEHHKDENPVAERLSKALADKRERVAEVRGEELEDSQGQAEASADDASSIEDVQNEQAISSDDIPPEVKADWDKLKPAVRHRIKEITNQCKEAKSSLQKATAHYNDMEAVFNRYLPNLDQLYPDPVTRPSKGRIVSSLMTWVGRLSDPNPHARATALQDLANRYSIDLGQVANYQPPYDANYYDDPNYAQSMQEQQLYQEQLQYQQEVQAAEQKSKPHVESWSKDKPHFDKVRSKMAQILEGMLRTGAVPANEDVSKPIYLDMAYQIATGLDPAVAAQINKARSKNVGRRENPNKNKPAPATVRGAIQEAFEQVKNRE